MMDYSKFKDPCPFRAKVNWQAPDWFEPGMRIETSHDGENWSSLYRDPNWDAISMLYRPTDPAIREQLEKRKTAMDYPEYIKAEAGRLIDAQRAKLALCPYERIEEAGPSTLALCQLLVDSGFKPAVPEVYKRLATAINKAHRHDELFFDIIPMLEKAGIGLVDMREKG